MAILVVGAPLPLEERLQHAPGTAMHSAPDRDGAELSHHTLAPGSQLAAPLWVRSDWVVSEGPNGTQEWQRFKLPAAAAS